MTDVTVPTQSGALRGRSSEGIATFFGVPYAEPPIGALRWRPPEAVKPWSGTRDAIAFGADAMQRAPSKTSRASGISEDCLKLNIWAPADISEPLPVMVWFHGGSFIMGSATDIRTDGAVFARGGVIFVSITSRLGIFGWLAHPELTAESAQGSAGNYGTLDQIEALRWLRANIAAFGGDPKRITLFGVSSGGASIVGLMTSPLAAGLFDRVILESAGAFRPLAPLADASAAGAELGSLANLRALSADDVLALEPRLIPAVRKLTAPRTLRMIRDGWVIPLDDREAFETSAFHAMPAIVGSNTDEGSRLTATWPANDLAGWNAIIEDNFARRSDDARRLYPAAKDGDAKGAVADMFGDTQFLLGTREIARAVGRAGRNAYRYLFTKRRAGERDGPHHGGEVAYVFGHLDEPPAGVLGHPDARDIALSDAMRASWIAFAATGTPGRIDGLDWPTAEHGFVELGEQSRISRDWREAQLDFLNAYARSE